MTYKMAALTRKPTIPLPKGVILWPVRLSINQPTTIIARAASNTEPKPEIRNPGTRKATMAKTTADTIKRMT